MKTSPRTSIVLATTLLTGGLVAGSVSNDVLQPAKSGFLGNAGSFFSPLESTKEPEIQVSNSANGESTSPIAIATPAEPAAIAESTSPSTVRLAVEPTGTPVTQTPIDIDPPIEVTPETSPTPDPIPSATPAPAETPEIVVNQSPQP